MKVADLLQLRPSVSIYDALTYLLGRAETQERAGFLRGIYTKVSEGAVSETEAKRLLLEEVTR